MPLTRRRFLSTVAGMASASAIAATGRRPAVGTIDVKELGAFGNGKLPDLRQIREAIRLAGERAAGATIFFPPGDYFLGAADDTVLLDAQGLRNVRFVGKGATLSCRSVAGQSTMLQLSGCRGVTVEGINFRDHGLKRNINWLGAAAVRLAHLDGSACEEIQIRNCEFDSVLAALVCRKSDDHSQTRCTGITLSALTVSRSYYGFNFQDNGDHVVGRGLRCNDVKRSYFPFGVSNHDIELETVNNSTGFTDVLIKCYQGDTSRIKAKVTCRGKRGGDAIVALDHQHEHGRGVIRHIDLQLDIGDVDCALDAAVLIRSFDPKARHEKHTNNRWEDIAIEGDVDICDKTRLIDIATIGRTAGVLRIGPRLAKHPRLPRSFPGFTVSGL